MCDWSAYFRKSLHLSRRWRLFPSGTVLPAEHLWISCAHEKARHGAGLLVQRGKAYFTSTARLSTIFLFQIAGPVMCTDSPLVSTATVTGMSFTSNS